MSSKKGDNNMKDIIQDSIDYHATKIRQGENELKVLHNRLIRVNRQDAIQDCIDIVKTIKTINAPLDYVLDKLHELLLTQDN